MDTTKFRRPWYQFSLRTMLIVMAVLAAGFGYWVHWSREWIRQRHEALNNFARELNPPEIVDLSTTPMKSKTRIAPAGLWLFGEKGVWRLSCHSEKYEQVKRLFPEAWMSPPVPEEAVFTPAN